MKKLLCVLLVLVLVFTLAACGSNNTEENEIRIRANTEGMGEIAFAYEGEELDFGEDATQMLQITVYEPEKITFAARPDEGFKFVKWTQDGEDISEEAEVEVEITKDTELVAYFEAE